MFKSSYVFPLSKIDLVEQIYKDWNPEKYLQMLHTRELMNIRKILLAEASQIYHYSGCFDDDGNNIAAKFYPFYHHPSKLGELFVVIKQVNAELSTREHIPNKLEAKAIRQAKAKAQRNR